MRVACLVVLLALGPADVQAQANPGVIARTWGRLTDEAYLRAGYGVVQWAMDIRRASDGASARLVQRDDDAIFLSYGSKPNFIRDSNFGYTFMVNFVDFSMTRQTVAGEEFADVGTEVDGYLVYAVPTLYYQWGGRRVGKNSSAWARASAWARPASAARRASRPARPSRPRSTPSSRALR
jgi:hypothetical protein